MSHLCSIFKVIVYLRVLSMQEEFNRTICVSNLYPVLPVYGREIEVLVMDVERDIVAILHTFKEWHTKTVVSGTA